MTKFEGFETPNTTPVPDIVFDELLEKLTGNELKALLYIIRRTFGFGKSADAISLSQFRKGIVTQEGKVLDRGCGIKHNRTILEALESLEKRGYIASRKRTTNAGDADTTVYKMRFKAASEAQADVEVVTPRNDVVISGNDGSYPTSLPSLPHVTTVVTPRNQQETDSQDTEIQETDVQGDTGASAPTPPALPANVIDLSESQKLRAATNALLNRFEVTPDMEVPSQGDGLDSTQRMAAVRPQGGTDGQLDAALHVRTHLSAAADDAGQRGAPDAALPGNGDSAAADIPPVVSGVSTGEMVAPPQTVRGADAFDRSTGGGLHSPPADRLSPSVSSAARAPGAKRSEKPTPPPIPDAALAILDDWDSLFKAPVARTEKHVEAAITLIPCRPSKMDLHKCKGWLFTTDNPQRPWYRKKGVKLTDVAENYGAWQSVQEDEPGRDEPPVLAATGTDDLSAYGQSGFDVYKGNGPAERKALIDYFEAHNLEEMFAND